jgi:hypothetical protein
MNKFRIIVATTTFFAFALILFGINYVSNAQSSLIDKQNRKINPVVVKSDRLCGTDHDPKKIEVAEVDFAARFEKLRNNPEMKVSSGVINVYFHVVSSGTTGNISDQMIILLPTKTN